MRGTSGTGTVKQFRVRGFRRVGSSQKAFWKFVCHKEQEIFVVTADNGTGCADVQSSKACCAFGTRDRKGVVPARKRLSGKLYRLSCKYLFIWFCA